MNGTVVLGPRGIEPLAGTHVLQDFRLVVDVTHHTIRRARAMKAKVEKKPQPSQSSLWNQESQ